MIFFFISILAGMLTILAPCILPLLPIVISSSEPGKRSISKRAIVVILSLSVSIFVFTLLLKASTLLISIPQVFWNVFSGIIIIFVGITIIFPLLWSHIPLLQKIKNSGNKVLGIGYKKKNHTGDILVGTALGPVFSTCSPTYLFIIATILPVGFFTGLIYLFGFIIGLAFSLFLLAYFGQQLVGRITSHMGKSNRIKIIFGVLIIVVGVAILTGYDKKIETLILDLGYGATIDFEENLIKRFSPQKEESLINSTEIIIPRTLKRSFPNTDWNFADPNIEKVISGGPGKDGIPSIDNPRFEPIASFSHSDNIQAIVIKDKDIIKVYPYNILNWHEIVNDTANDIPIAITFCPLCGTAIVYDRRVENKTLTFGVSGFLLESNMIMFDRENESLWQQSTGRVLAGENLERELSLISFQLLTIGDVKEKYPKAVVLSEDTGYHRDYERNPYSGYEDSQGFIFPPSREDIRFPAKDIFVVFRIKEDVVAVPWNNLEEKINYETTINKEKITLFREDGILHITDSKENEIPFYFEMWFSFIAQHGDSGIVFDPKK